MNSAAIFVIQQPMILRDREEIMLQCNKNTYNHGDISGTNFAMESAYVLNQLIISAIVVTCFICTKTIVDSLRRRNARLTLVIIGAGPIGLTSMLVAARCGRVSRIVLYEELSKLTLFNKPHQIALDVKSVHFLKRLGVDFDNIEGCWDSGCFYTRLGVFQEYMLTTVPKLGAAVDLRLGTKFTRDSLRDLEKIDGRKLVLACDGSSGQAARLLGLSDEFAQHSCRAYGAVAALDRPDECQIPMPERLMHNLHFDLTAYGAETSEVDGYQGFSFKVFGTSRHRFMSLSIPKCESPQVKSLRTVLDRSMMRNIFLKCFNTYKADSEPRLSDPIAVKHMKFSPRLFEVKLSQRLETSAYFQDSNMFVLAEGEAARCYNIHTGMDVNVGIKGLMGLSSFISLACVVDSEHAILQALLQKNKDADRICRDFIKAGLVEYHMLKTCL
uniref:FAD-binding domain-containing protein n=1 Tax=Arion vulgaris TaxID=1028688 RepID=A0A0B6ZV97_9EUPU